METAASPSLGGEWLFAAGEDDPSSPVEETPPPPLRDPRASTAVCGLPVWVTDLFCFGPISATTDQVLRQARGRRVPTALLPPTVTRVDVLAVNRLSLAGDPVYVRVLWDGADLGATPARARKAENDQTYTSISDLSAPQRAPGGVCSWGDAGARVCASFPLERLGQACGHECGLEPDALLRLRVLERRPRPAAALASDTEQQQQLSAAAGAADAVDLDSKSARGIHRVVHMRMAEKRDH